jgi:hypothetical protein
VSPAASLEEEEEEEEGAGPHRLVVVGPLLPAEIHQRQGVRLADPWPRREVAEDPSPEAEAAPEGPSPEEGEAAARNHQG